MRAWLLDDLTGIEHLRIADATDPRAGPGEAILEIAYAGLNPAVRSLAERQSPVHPPLPHVLGRDGIGRVTEVGSGVSDLRVGDKRAILRGDVGVSRWGTFAERVTVPVENLVQTPADWTDQEAAG